MKKTSLNIFPRFFAFSLVCILLLSFVHSELGDCSLHEEHHASHDYCMMIKGANVNNTSIQQAKIFGFELTKELFVEFDYLVRLQESGRISGKFCFSESPPDYGEVFLKNMAFRI